MLIVLTSDVAFENEVSLIHRLFKEGLATLHIRKSGLNLNGLREFIRQIDEKYHPNLVIHRHHELSNEFKLKGIHLKEQHRKNLGSDCTKYLGTFSSNGFTVSTSFHELETLNAESAFFDYCFLSPVFSSISKQGYKGKGINVARNRDKVIALGGVCENNIETALALGYKGAGILGAIWQSKTPIAAFKAIQKCMLRTNAFHTIEN